MFANIMGKNNKKNSMGTSTKWPTNTELTTGNVHKTKMKKRNGCSCMSLVNKMMSTTTVLASLEVPMPDNVNCAVFCVTDFFFTFTFISSLKSFYFIYLISGPKGITERSGSWNICISWHGYEITLNYNSSDFANGMILVYSRFFASVLKQNMHSMQHLRKIVTKILSMALHLEKASDKNFVELCSDHLGNRISFWLSSSTLYLFSFVRITVSYRNIVLGRL